MRNKIDWLNHGIAFLAALLGILVAFQLEDYQENRQGKEELKITLNAIKAELDNNRLIYKSNVDRLSEFLTYMNLIGQNLENGEIRIRKEVYEKMKPKFPARFAEWELVKEVNDSLLIFTKTVFLIDVVPETGISTSSWQAGIYSGVLNRLNHDKLAKLTNIYEWIQKDMGIDEASFYDNVLVATSEYMDHDQMIQDYGQIVKIQKFKLAMVNMNYDKIEWK